jgi:predicted TIM-barrel fold metal-dependent hydrolase
MRERGSPVIVVDSQVHVWKAETPDRPWPKSGVAPHVQLDAPLGFEDLSRRMTEAGVDRAVLVPPSWEGDRIDYVLEAARAHPDRFAAMGRTPLDELVSRNLVAEWKTYPGLLGLRLTLVWEREREWLRDGTADWFWPAAEAAGLPVTVMAPNNKPEIGRIAERHPGLKLCIDHLGLQTAVAKAGRVAEAAQETIALSKHKNVCVKLSGIGGYSSDTYPWRDLDDHIARAVDAFGPARCFWGTDLSRVLPKMSYRECVTHFTEALFEGPLRHLSDRERSLVMGEAMLAWLGWT